MAVPNIYPLVFPPHGYHGQLNWLGDIATCMGKEAVAAISTAYKEGELELPSHIEIKLVSGQTVHVGPSLTEPNPSIIKSFSKANITRNSIGLLITPQPNLEEGSEEDEGDEENCDFDEKPKKENKVYESWIYRKDLLRNRKLFVSYDNLNVTSKDLKTHFEQFGVVENVFITKPFTNFATITFTSEVLAQSLAGRDHTLNGSIPLRLRGGSGRHQRVPPNEQRNAVCPFRFTILINYIL